MAGLGSPYVDPALFAPRYFTYSTTKGSTDTHERDYFYFSRVITRTGDGVDNWTKDTESELRTAEAKSSQTVTLTGAPGSEKATASITSQSKSLREIGESYNYYYSHVPDHPSRYGYGDSREGTRVGSNVYPPLRGSRAVMKFCRPRSIENR